MRFFLCFMLLALAATISFATDGKMVYAQYRKIIDDQSKSSPDRVKQGQAFLQALDRADFLAFIHESTTVDGYDDQNEAIHLAMAVFAKSYILGPGRNEALPDILAQFSDPTLPTAWKTGLLDVLNLENRSDLSESNVYAIVDLLTKMANEKQEPEAFRSFCLGRLGSLLFTQREIITQNAPDLKDALEKQNRTALPKRDDAIVKQAAKLIDAIQAYQMVLQKTADEVKDEQIKANLKKRLAKWGPPSVPVLESVP